MGHKNFIIEFPRVYYLKLLQLSFYSNFVMMKIETRSNFWCLANFPLKCRNVIFSAILKLSEKQHFNLLQCSLHFIIGANILDIFVQNNEQSN